MTTAELLQTMRDALAVDPHLHAWCLDQFGKAPSVHLGIDENDPPTDGDYPVVALVGVEQVRGESAREIEWRVILGVGVVNPEIVQSGIVRTQTGLLQAETLRELSENALYRARLCDVDSAGDASSESYHPLYVSYTTVSIRHLKSTRKGLP